MEALLRLMLVRKGTKLGSLPYPKFIHEHLAENKQQEERVMRGWSVRISEDFT